MAISEPTAGDDVRGGEAVWECDRIDQARLGSYMRRLEERARLHGLAPPPVARSLALLAASGYDADRALLEGADDPTLRKATPAPVARGSADDDECWADEGERRLFEYAYLHFGKNFYAIADFLHRTVAQVQEHYYTWKNGEDYRRFLARHSALQAHSPEDDDEEGGEEEEEEEGGDDGQETPAVSASAPIGIDDIGSAVPTRTMTSAMDEATTRLALEEIPLPILWQQSSQDQFSTGFFPSDDGLF